MNVDKTTENTNKLLEFVARKFQAGELNNESLVQLIELAGDFLNLKTIPNYSKYSGKSYNGIKKYSDVRIIRGVKFVIDNE